MGDDDRQTKWRRLIPTVNRKRLAKRMRDAEDVTTRHARRFIFRRLDSIREARRKIIMWVIAVAVLIGATGLQLIWYQQGYRTKAFTDGGVYAEAVLGPLDTLNPLFASSRAEQSASRLLFSGLFKYDAKGALGGDLATSIKLDKTGTLYTVKLRTDALWHDGFRVTANDVVFTVNLMKNPAVRSTTPEDWNGIEVKAVDDQTVTFKLPAVVAAFPHALTFSVLPRHLLTGVEPNAIRENNFSQQPVGSGPFKMRLLQNIEFTANHKVVYLERNVDYYKGQAKLERFQLHAYASQEEILKALNSGEVNAAADLSLTTIAGVEWNRFEVKSVPVQSGVYALFNTSRGALSDVKVRRALQIGTDTAAIRRQVSDSQPALYLPFTNGQLTGKVPAAPKFDQAQAKKLLNEAGWKLSGGVRKKGKTVLKLTVVSTKDSSYERAFEALVGQWRDLGIQVETQTLDISDSNQRLAQDTIQSRNYDVMLYQLTIGADPDVYAYWHSSQAGYGGLNLSNYSSEIADDALSSARSRVEPALRNAKYLTFARRWLADAPAIGLYQSTTNYVYGKNDRTFDNANKFVSSLDRYSDVLYWAVSTETVYKTP